MFRQSWLMQITSKQCQEKDQTKAATQTSCRSGSKEGKKRVLTLCSQLIHGGRHRDTARELIVAEQGSQTPDQDRLPNFLKFDR